MYLFSRAVTLRGSPRRVGPWVQQITAYVREHSSLDAAAWRADFGHPIGTMVWTARVDSHAALAEATGRLAADEGYLDLLESGQDLIVAPGEDSLREMLHGAAGDPPPVGSTATVTEATALVDRMADAIGWGVEMAEHVEQVTDAPVSLSRNVYGTLGRLTWIGIQPDAAATDATNAKLSADPGYLSRMTGTAGLFLPGSGHVATFTRMV